MKKALATIVRAIRSIALKRLICPYCGAKLRGEAKYRAHIGFDQDSKEVSDA